MGVVERRDFASMRAWIQWRVALCTPCAPWCSTMRAVPALRVLVGVPVGADTSVPRRQAAGCAPSAEIWRAGCWRLRGPSLPVLCYAIGKRLPRLSRVVGRPPGSSASGAALVYRAAKAGGARPSLVTYVNIRPPVPAARFLDFPAFNVATSRRRSGSRPTWADAHARGGCAAGVMSEIGMDSRRNGSTAARTGLAGTQQRRGGQRWGLSSYAGNDELGIGHRPRPDCERMETRRERGTAAEARAQRVRDALPKCLSTTRCHGRRASVGSVPTTGAARCADCLEGVRTV